MRRRMLSIGGAIVLALAAAWAGAERAAAREETAPEAAEAAPPRSPRSR